MARWQLLAAGISPRQIEVRLASSRMVELHRGVYLVGSVAPAHANEMAALLVFRLEAALSHRTAAALWELAPYPASAPVWVTVAPGRSAARPRLKVVRSKLERRDVRSRGPLRLTSPPRTILDLAAVLGPEDVAEQGRLTALERIVAEATYRGLASEGELRAQIERNPHKRGVRALRSVLGLAGGPRRTRSPAERDMLGLLRERGIAGFEVNARVGIYEVDFLWRDAGLAVEIDGYDAHSGRVAFERDRLKAATLNAAGIAVMPVTGRQVCRDPDGVVARLTAALQARAR